MIKITTKYKGLPAAMASERGVAEYQIKNVFEAAYKKIAEHWHRFYRKRHFTKAGAKRYGYAKRHGDAGEMRGTRRFNRTYQGRKKRQFGHTDPLTFTGLSKKLSGQRDFRVKHDGVKIVLHTPALSLRPKGGKINMQNEMRRLASDERDRLNKIFERTVATGLNKIRTTKEKRFRH